MKGPEELPGPHANIWKREINVVQSTDTWWSIRNCSRAYHYPN